MRKSFLLALLLAVLRSMPALAQDITVSGKVVDSSGEPIIGATVRAQGEKTGVITDKDGNFRIVMPKGKNSIVVSYLGYKEAIARAILGKLMKIKMKEDAQNLDELVVVGYGTQKKSALTSSIETVKGEDLLRMPTPNLDQALNGQVAGLQVMSLSGDPGAAREASIRIRAMSGAVSSPLLVIDGIPRFSENTTDGEQRLSDLNPDDIESISILKDAAAAAVYGVRAANGVILVKTKRATGDSKVRVNYRGQFNIQEATQFPHFLKSYEFAKLYNKAVEGASYKGFFVSVMFQGVAGFKQYVSEMYSLENNSLPKFQDYHLTDCWTPENRDASFPRVKLATARDNNRKKSSFWVRDNSFVRLKSVSVGYSLPSSVLSKLKLSSLSVSLMGGNLHTWSKLKYMDPESMRGYPIQRTYGINANIGF